MDDDIKTSDLALYWLNLFYGYGYLVAVTDDIECQHYSIERAAKNKASRAALTDQFHVGFKDGNDRWK